MKYTYIYIYISIVGRAIGFHRNKAVFPNLGAIAHWWAISIVGRAIKNVIQMSDKVEAVRHIMRFPPS